jgi:hypothetical protein
MQSNRDRDARFQLMIRLISEHQQGVKRFRLGLDKKGLAVERGERSLFIKLPLIVVHFCNSRPISL